MASVVIGSPAYNPVVFPRETYSVWVKREWGDAWIRVPYAIPKGWSETAAPSQGSARFRWEYGAYVNLWYHNGGTLLPIDIESWLIKFVVHSIYGNYIGFIGEVVGEHMREEGVSSATGNPTGYQEYECADLKSLLERRRVLGTYVGDGTNWVYLQRTRHFNVGYSHREGRTQNRSNNYHAEAGCYMFEDGGTSWSNYDIIEHLLACFQPWYPAGNVPGGAISLSPLFRVVGQTDALRYIYGEHRFWGKSIFQCLDQLIDRRRGFGWRIATDGVGPIYIVVYSLSEYEVWGQGAYVPANPSQGYIQIGESHHVSASFHITSMRQVDRIVVESDEPVKVMTTMGFDDGSMEEGWSAELDLNLPATDETDLAELAAQLILEFDDMNVVTEDPYILYSQTATGASLREFQNYTGYSETLFNQLDVDGDGWLTVTDLETFAVGVPYQNASDEERGGDLYSAVFSKFQVPRTFDMSSWIPSVSDFGFVDMSGAGAYFNHDLSFERHLPIEEKGVTGEREYLEPFALVAKPNRNRDVVLQLLYGEAAPYSLEGAQAYTSPPMTDAEFNTVSFDGLNITDADIDAALDAIPAYYLHVDKLQQIEDYPDCSTRPADVGLAFFVKSKINHIFALNSFNSTSETDPLVDYKTMLFTGMFRTDQMLRVALSVWTGTYVDQYGNTQYASNPQGKEVHIVVPGQECWCVAPYTVTGVKDGELVLWNDGAPGIIRNDMARIWWAAVVAYVWYGQQRAAAELTIQNSLPWFHPGDLVKAAFSGYWMERIGTVVTSVTHDCETNTQVVRTAYGEMDPAVAVSNGGDT